MTDRRFTRRQFGKALGLGLGAAALAPLVGTTLPERLQGLVVPRASAAGRPDVALDPALPVHPALQYGAQVEPDKVVRVIVRKVRPGDDGRAIAQAAGGCHLEAFAFIQGHVVELPQRAALRLALDPRVRFVSPDGPVQRHATALSAAALLTTYPVTTRAATVWNSPTVPASGNGVTVAVLDTGVNSGHPDLVGRRLLVQNVNKRALGAGDAHGHGTHVTGIITGRDGAGNYIGVAPSTRVISVKIADDQGMAQESDLLRGLQWCYDNRLTYNLRVVNLSLGSGTAQSYTTSPVSAAVEQLWLNGVVVVVAAGNRGTAADATWYPPANDPYVITVGALDENQTGATGDDALAPFSSRGATQDGYYKPEVLAPGRRIMAPLASAGCTLATTYPDRIAADGQHIRLSGTSMAAPVITGVVALLYERTPNLTPDQVKWLLLKSTYSYKGMADKVGAIDAMKAMTGATAPLGAANQGLTPNSGIAPGTDTATWGQNGYWDTAYWDTAYWDTGYWDVATDYD